MTDAEILDDLSGFEFEDLMEDVFSKLGYHNVRQDDRVSDEGRDILMEEDVDGERRAAVVECKHTGLVGRPVVQKLHSAVATFDFDGPKRGMVVTSGRYSSPAREYAEDLRRRDDPYPIELIDGDDLREIADEIGLDLLNGRIEIICNDTLSPVHPSQEVEKPVYEEFEEIDNISTEQLPRPTSEAVLRPVVTITAETNATFETSVGVIHRVHEADRFVARAERGSPEVLSQEVAELVEGNRHQMVEIDENELESLFDDYRVLRYGQTETEYKDWAEETLRRRYTTTVRYTGDNNVTYTKECQPNESDISVQEINPVYLPEIKQNVSLGKYDYPLEYYAAGESQVTTENGIHGCIQCDTQGKDSLYTYCGNCSSINCPQHIKTERLERTPVCTGCAVIERFAFKKKYFYGEDNLESFRQQYEEMPVHQKVMENKPGLLAAVTTILIIVFSLLYYTRIM